jgi:hypothetical protein
VITSDHGHCEILSDREQAVICLDRTLEGFRQATLGEPWQAGDEIMICPNMRATQVYFRAPNARSLRKAIAASLVDAKVDHAIYRGSDIDGVVDHFWIESRKGALEFWRGGMGASHGCDAYGNTWSWQGDLTVVDAHVEDQQLHWKDYPNAFERVAGILESPDSGTLWLTAQPGCEFEVPGSTAHCGGSSHGGLHALESLCPVIVAGPERIELPKAFRTIDIAPLCLNLLGVPSRYRIGDPRRAHS